MSTPRTEAGVQVAGLETSFGSETVLRDVDLTVEPGEFCVLIGPSGSGKSTVLKCIAGLLDVDDGRILVDGTDITDAPVNQRDMGFVFQDFEETLFPHMTVAENVSFGLQQSDQAYSAADIESRVSEMLELLAISETRDDTPEELSGGQQQRVELARHLVRECDVMLLDDPLADLDYKLQKRMELELRRIHADSGGTYLYVTHNQDQALSLADKLVVINDGQIEQTGTPTEVYENPTNAFVGRFVGDSNLFETNVADVSGTDVIAETPIGQIDARAGHDGIEAGGEGVVLIRPENVLLGDDATEATNRFEATVENRIYTGERTEFFASVAVDGTEQTVQSIYSGNVTLDGLTPGSSVQIGWNRADTVCYSQLSSTGEVTVEELEEL